MRDTIGARSFADEEGMARQTNSDHRRFRAAPARRASGWSITTVFVLMALVLPGGGGATSYADDAVRVGADVIGPSFRDGNAG